MVGLGGQAGPQARVCGHAPPSSTVSRPSRLATPTTLLTWTSTTASWNEAAAVAARDPGHARMAEHGRLEAGEREVVGAVVQQRLGNRTAGSPSRARRSTTARVAEPSTRATLS